MGRSGVGSRGTFLSGVKKRSASRVASQRSLVVPGITRQVGFYNRFNGKDGPGELKFFDVDLTDTVVATGGVVTDSINKIAQGTTENTRIGRKCTIKQISCRFDVDIPKIDAQASAGGGEILRVIFFLDKQCNGATAAVLDILETADVHSFRNLSNSGRFQVLHDKVYMLNYTTLASDGAGVVSSAKVTRQHTWYKKCNIPLEFSGTAGAITEIRSNNIGVLLVAENGNGGFESKFRLRFSDNGS